MLATSMLAQFEEFCPDLMRQAKQKRGPLTEEQFAKRFALTWYDRYEIAAELVKRSSEATCVYWKTADCRTEVTDEKV